MYRKVFSSDEVADIVFKIVGEIEPVGETHTDDARFDHLQTLLNTLDILIDEVTFLLPCENRYEYSMQRAGQEVRHWLKDKHQQFEYNLWERWRGMTDAERAARARKKLVKAVVDAGQYLKDNADVLVDLAPLKGETRIELTFTWAEGVTVTMNQQHYIAQCINDLCGGDA